MLAHKLILLILILMIGGRTAGASQPSLFDSVGQSEGVPPLILYSISLVESSRPGTNSPWPWAVNVSGKSYWFRDKSSAIAAAKQAIRSGVKNVDVGVMQTNWYWHGHRFKSLEDAFDPETNLKVAASIFKEFSHLPLFVAIGKYHCPSNVGWCQKKARNYAHKVVNKLRGLSV